MDNAMRTYSTKEVAKRLSIEPVTVRKYAGMLEDKGYIYKKDEREWRVFVEDDIKALEYLSLLKSDGHSLESAIDRVASLFRSNLVVAQPDMALQEDKKYIFDFIKRQEAFNQSLLERIDQRDKNLMAVLREIQETKKELAAAHQKRWWKFWKR
jgi:DNA-binding transcriptional MerR regulator